MEIGDLNWKELIKKGAYEMTVNISQEAIEKFAIHAKEIIKWNKKINLTAIIDPFEIAVKHYLDSVAAINFIPNNAYVLDIGTGAGFPGIPLKIINPSLNLVLIDASLKKINFILDIIRKLELKDTKAYHIRVENFIKDNDDKFDIIVCRAFASIYDIIKIAVTLLKQDGFIIALKGKTDDIYYISNKFNNSLNIEIKKYELPFIQAKRSIIKINRSEF